MSNPTEVLRELVNAVLEWDKADTHRLRLMDSKSAKPADLQAANVQLVAAIKRLRAAAKKMRQLIQSPLKKPKKPLNWGAIVSVAAKALSNIDRELKDRPIPARVIDARNIEDAQIVE